MKHFINLLTLLVLISCTSGHIEVSDSDDSGPVASPERLATGVVCPVHQEPVFKIKASPAIVCYVNDPKHGLPLEQIRKRYPFAVWDSNLHQIDDSPGARFPEYNLVCGRCQDSWNDYVASNPVPPSPRLEVSISENQRILIDGNEVSIEQISAKARAAVSRQLLKPRLYLRADQSTPTELVRAVMNACAEEGITDVIFGSSEANTKANQESSEAGLGN